MAQIKKLKENGKTIYPVTTPKAVIDPSTGRAINAEATQSAAGLMSSDDKTKLDQIMYIPLGYIEFSSNFDSFKITAPSSVRKALYETIKDYENNTNTRINTYYSTNYNDFAITQLLNYSYNENVQEVYFSFIVIHDYKSYLLTASLSESQWEFGSIMRLSGSEFALY